MGTKTFQALMDRNLNILNIYEDATHAAEKENIAWKCEQAAYNIIFDRLYFPDQLTSGQLKKWNVSWAKQTGVNAPAPSLIVCVPSTMGEYCRYRNN